MRVLVCGGRYYDDQELLEKVLDEIHAQSPITEIIQGGAMGADLMACKWALFTGVKLTSFKADWKTHGLSAGPIRNQAMADTMPDRVVAFPGGKGTADMVRRARSAGIQVREITK